MNFEELIKRLSNGETMEQITKGSNVECVGNEVYEDNDLHEFLNSIGAEIEEFGTGFAVLNTDNNKIYELPYTTPAELPAPLRHLHTTFSQVVCFLLFQYYFLLPSL